MKKKLLVLICVMFAISLVPFVCAAQDTQLASQISWEYNGGDVIENGITLNGNYDEYTYDGVTGVGKSDCSYIYFNIDTSKFMVSDEYTYKIKVDYYDGGYSNNRDPSKNFCVSLSSGTPNVRMFPSLDATDVSSATDEGWKTAWLDVPSTAAGAVNFNGIINGLSDGVAGASGANIRIGNSKAKLTNFYISKITIETYRTPVIALMVSEPTYTVDEQISDAPATGFVKTSVSLNNIDTYKVGTSIKLIVASVNKATGKIEAISADSTDNMTTPKDTLTAGVAHNADTCDYKYFVWDSNNNSVINCAPSMPQNFSVQSKATGTYISFDASEDDFDAIDKYVIYRDGEEYKTLYAASGVLDVTEDNHTYYMVAYDHYGVASEPTEEITGETVSMLGILLEGETKDDVNANSYGITFDTIDGIDANDKCSEQASKDGVYCRKTFDISEIRQQPDRFSMLYFKVDKQEIPQDETDITFEITYFDEGTGNINLQYNNTSNSVATAKVATRTNTNTWKKAVVQLTNAKLSANINGCDFRISGVAANPEIYISKVEAVPTHQYQ